MAEEGGGGPPGGRKERLVRLNSAAQAGAAAPGAARVSSHGPLGGRRRFVKVECPGVRCSHAAALGLLFLPPKVVFTVSWERCVSGFCFCRITGKTIFVGPSGCPWLLKYQ